MSFRRPFANILLLLALLFAQQAALWHGLWHAGQEFTRTADAASSLQASGVGHDAHQSALCPLDHAFGSVLGVIDGGAPVLVHVAAVHVLPLPAVQSDCCIRQPTPVSRGPPSALLS